MLADPTGRRCMTYHSGKGADAEIEIIVAFLAGDSRRPCSLCRHAAYRTAWGRQLRRLRGNDAVGSLPLSATSGRRTRAATICPQCQFRDTAIRLPG